MQVSLENVGTLERKLTVRIPSAQLDARVRDKMRELGQTVRLKGFRPGKVPPKIIEQRFGPQVRTEAMQDMISSSYQEAVRQQNLRPAAAPKIEAKPGNDELEYTATFEVVPEIGAIDVSSLEVIRPQASVGDGDVDTMIDTLRMQRRTWEPVARESRSGDMVLFEFSATMPDMRHPAVGTERAGTILGIGALFPEFEAQLTGVRADDERSARLSFPANFREAALAGKTADVSFKVIRVQESHMPEIDETFAASFGVKDGGLDKFRADVRANLERELQAQLKGRLKSNTVERLVAQYADLEIPRGMVQTESRALLQQAQQNAKRAGVGEPHDVSLFVAEATTRVRAFLLLNEIARQNKISPDPQQVNQMLATIASTYEEPEKVVEMYMRDPEMINSLRNRVLEDQVVEWVVQHAKARDENLTFAQVMQPRG